MYDWFHTDSIHLRFASNHLRDKALAATDVD